MTFCCCCCDKSKAKVDDSDERAKPLLKEKSVKFEAAAPTPKEVKRTRPSTKEKRATIGGKSITDMLQNQPSISEYSDGVPDVIKPKRGSVGGVSITDMMKSNPSWLDAPVLDKKSSYDDDEIDD